VKITAMQEYGLRCILQLAAQEGGALLSVKEIARRERLTPVYVEKILVTLRKAGLVKSRRGVKGGYVLSRRSVKISVAEVLGSLGQVDLGQNLCKRFTGKTEQCVHSGRCGVRQVWVVLTRAIYGFLSRLSLDQLVRGEMPAPPFK
jgi:Rrf2 family protein